MENTTALTQTITSGKYAVIPTDTIYGIVCGALNKDAVEGLYEIKDRTSTKPFIVLLNDIDQLQLFGIDAKKYADVFDQYWPGPVSIIIPCSDDRFEYLHRGTQRIAFRLPNNVALQDLIRHTGPLVAPSANTQGLSPATTIEEAKEYFGESVSCYVDGGTVVGTPSTIIMLEEDGTVTKIR